MSENGKVVCVTGASGYIASWPVKLRLHKSYTGVTPPPFFLCSISPFPPPMLPDDDHDQWATLNDPKKTEHLRQLEGASERLHLFKADLLEEGLFDAVINDCEGVFHTASPFYHGVTDPQAELIDPAVKGTLNVLRACAKATSVKREVVTSSIAAVAFNERPRAPDVIVDETWFSSPEICKKNKVCR